ncbi:MAG: twin-arginine translocase subunit TatC [candidate division Zixibacteria bacterium]|nr:twin-arginine translocase subunit TatC [candidate division Zixibacteria bacterium]
MLTKPPEKEMSFLEHLEELRSRLIKSVVVIIAMAVVVYFFSEKLVDFFTAPLPQVYFMAPTEAFMVRIKLSLIGGAIVSIPVVFYHLWMFIGPGLLKSEAKIVIPIVISATIFFLIGAALCFFVMLPVAVKFMLGFSTAKLQPLISIDNYISFAGMLILAFGLVFELPVASFILGRMGVINARMLSKGRRYAIVVILIASAILTPTPDAFNQLLLAGPMYVLYEISIIVVWFTGRKRGETK